MISVVDGIFLTFLLKIKLEAKGIRHFFSTKRFFDETNKVLVQKFEASESVLLMCF